MQLFDITNLWHSFTLPRKTKFQIAACVLCFFIFYGLFYAILYGQTKSEAYILLWTQKASAYGMVISTPKVEFFPPAISIARMHIKQKNNLLTLQDVYASLNVFSDTVSFEAKVLEGNIEGSVELSSLFNPEYVKLDVQCDAIALPLLATFAGLRKSGALIQILQGTLQASLIADIPIKTQKGKSLNLASSTGTIKLKMQDGAITHGMPLLVASRFDALQGEAEITWDKRKIHVQQVLITNPELYISLNGGITANMLKPLDSSLDISAILRIPLDQLHTEFVPPRTLKALKEKEQVVMNITKTLRNPAVDVKL